MVPRWQQCYPSRFCVLELMQDNQLPLHMRKLRARRSALGATARSMKEALFQCIMLIIMICVLELFISES